MDNLDFNKMLLEKLQEKDEVIKYLVNDTTKLMDSYIKKDKEKDKRHMITIIAVLSLTIGFCVFFTGSYFFSNYNDHSTTSITGDGNSTSNINGSNNTNNQNKTGGVK